MKLHYELRRIDAKARQVYMTYLSGLDGADVRNWQSIAGLAG
ncbi:MAG: hypothetical protein ABR985_08280 [Methanotrichaceae archaeon]|jgi:hypothetical protein